MYHQPNINIIVHFSERTTKPLVVISALAKFSDAIDWLHVRQLYCWFRKVRATMRLFLARFFLFLSKQIKDFPRALKGSQMFSILSLGGNPLKF